MRPALRATLAALLIALPITASIAAEPRSASAKAEFKRTHPCPANGKRSGPCGGHVIDHVIPLCAGGADHPSNMQWQTIPEAKAKDRLERQQCKKR